MGAPTLSPYPCPSPALTGEPLEPFWPKGPCGEEKRGERRGLGATLGVQLPPTPPRGSCPPLPLSHPGDKAPRSFRGVKGRQEKRRRLIWRLGAPQKRR